MSFILSLGPCWICICICCILCLWVAHLVSFILSPGPCCPRSRSRSPLQIFIMIMKRGILGDVDDLGVYVDDGMIKNTWRLVQLPGAINQGGKVQPLCKSGDSRITLMMLKKCKIAHCKNQHDKNIKTFKKNEGPSLSCGEQSITWGIPTDKQRWSRVDNYKYIDLIKKKFTKVMMKPDREKDGWDAFLLSPFPHDASVPGNRDTSQYLLCFYLVCYYIFLEILPFCVFLITFQLHRNLYSWPVLICVCVRVLHSANKEAGTYFNEYFCYIF